MKTVIKFFIAILVLVVCPLSAQYTETFPIPNKGILPGTCNFTEASCLSDYSGVDWTINGDFSGMDNNDYVQTNGTGVLDFFGDIDGEICYESPVLDLTATSGVVSFSTDLVWNGHDGADYVDVEYQLGGGWVQIPNQFGGGVHTIDYGTSGNSGSATITQSGLTGGSTLSIRVCARTNTSAEGTTLDNVSVPTTGVTLQVLPVTWGDVTLKSHPRSNTVYWSTHSEINNDYFEVERSANGLLWTTLELVNEGITSVATRRYQYSDDTPLAGTSYYRIKQVDHDGKYAYSKVLTSRRAVSSEQTVYPNPFTNSLNVSYEEDSLGSAHTLTLYDAMGQIVTQQLATDREVQLSTADLPPGLYFVDNGFSMIKVLKQ